MSGLSLSSQRISAKEWVKKIHEKRDFWETLPKARLLLKPGIAGPTSTGDLPVAIVRVTLRLAVSLDGVEQQRKKGRASPLTQALLVLQHRQR